MYVAMFYHIRRLLPLFVMCFLLSLNYYLLKTMKDTLVITADNSGAEAIPFVKVWLLLPASILMAMAFTWLANHYSLKAVFYVVMGLFLGFYALFTFVLYPFQDHLHLHGFADWLQSWMPPGWKGFVSMVRYWIFSLFYVMAECWSSIVYAVLFWGLANEVTPLDEAEAHYPPLMLAGNLSAIVAGLLAIALTSFNGYIPFFQGLGEWHRSLILLTTLVLACGIGSVLLFQWAFSPALTKKAIEQPSSDKHMTFREALGLLVRSKFLLSLAILVFAFNLVVTLTEVEWKNQVLSVHPDSNGYHIYMNTVTSWIGVVSTLFTLILCTPMLRLFGWKITALFTPIVTLGSGLVFFGYLLVDPLSSWMSGIAAFLSLSPLSLGALLGSLHICLTRSGKYTLFDTTKEMAFIPLSSDERLKGKAAVDGVGSRLGKGASSLLYQGLLVMLPSVTACTPYVLVVLIGMSCLCIGSIWVLGGLFSKREKEQIQNLAL